MMKDNHFHLWTVLAKTELQDFKNFLSQQFPFLNTNIYKIVELKMLNVTLETSIPSQYEYLVVWWQDQDL